MGKIIKLNSYIFFLYDVVLLLKDGNTRLIQKGEKIREIIRPDGKRSYIYKGYEILNFHKL